MARRNGAARIRVGEGVLNDEWYRLTDTRCNRDLEQQRLGTPRLR